MPQVGLHSSGRKTREYDAGRSGPDDLEQRQIVPSFRKISAKFREGRRAIQRCQNPRTCQSHARRTLANCHLANSDAESQYLVGSFITLLWQVSISSCTDTPGTEFEVEDGTLIYSSLSRRLQIARSLPWTRNPLRKEVSDRCSEGVQEALIARPSIRPEQEFAEPHPGQKFDPHFVLRGSSAWYISNS